MLLFAVGSLAVHLKFHPPHENPGAEGLFFTNSVAAVFAFLDVVLVTFFFSRKKTAAWGYLINGLIAIYGIVLMTHWGWANTTFPGTPLTGFLFPSTFPYIVMACTDFLLGYVLYHLWHMPSPEKATPKPETAS
jgi:hypothetical protein